MPAVASSISGGGTHQGNVEWSRSGSIGGGGLELPWWLPIGLPFRPIAPMPWNPFNPAVSGDLKIKDAEYLSCEQYVVAYLDHLQTAGLLYSQILMKVRGCAVSDGESGIVAALDAKAFQMTQLMMVVSQIRGSIDGRARAFIERVDQLDDFVYGED
ncbi:MAG: hypothetical protein LBV06_08655 [Propionibacteriaceae bacterium]|jgi:hypothetical protein|nr:hypothetical protein [Propionibacteriaceae bacterium]